jgi:hypothetical protein
MIKNRRSSLSEAMESRTSDAFKEEIKEAMAEMVQKESEIFETDVEVIIVKLAST